LIDLTTYGRPINLREPVIGRISKGLCNEPALRGESILCSSEVSKAWGDLSGYRAVVTTKALKDLPHPLPAELPLLHTTLSISHLQDGDVVVLQPRNGLLRTLFRPESEHNALLVTERCNSFCLMCSQPPVDRDDSGLTSVNVEAIRLMKPPPIHLGITGGEPTLLGTGLFRLLDELKVRLPETSVHMLTNGRRFSRPEFTADFMAIGHRQLTLGIPLYSDNAPEHDYVVQARGAFDQTMQGLYQLARHDQPVEIRVVLHALTIPSRSSRENLSRIGRTSTWTSAGRAAYCKSAAVFSNLRSAFTARISRQSLVREPGVLRCFRRVGDTAESNLAAIASAFAIFKKFFALQDGGRLRNQCRLGRPSSRDRTRNQNCRSRARLN
jgi:Radical SAM superfamily